jgi:hypothetical protein
VDHDEDGYTGDAVLLDTGEARSTAQRTSGTPVAHPTAEAAPSAGDTSTATDAATSTGDAGAAAPAGDTPGVPDRAGGTAGSPGTDGAGQEIPVQVVVRGYVEPIDGRYHWYGRVAANDEVTALNRAGRKHVRLRTPEGEADGVLSDQDTWGRFRITGTGTPPFRVVTDPPPGSAAEPGASGPGQTGVSSRR